MPTVWQRGTSNIFGLAWQMILILAAGYAIAITTTAQRSLRNMRARFHTRLHPFCID